MGPDKRRPTVTAGLATSASSSAAAVRLRDEHLWPVVLDAMTLIREANTQDAAGRWFLGVPAIPC
jgi:hypothetical protein